MDSNSIEHNNAEQTATCYDPLNSGGVLDDAQALWHELWGLSLDRFRLAALETQRAGQSLVDMLVAGVMVAVLLSSAWLGLMAASVLWLTEHGVMASNAILSAVVCNLLLALIFCGVIRRKCHYLQFPATQHSFQSLSTAQRDAKKS